MAIKNLIFDFGGILIDLDWDRYYNNLQALLKIENDSEALKNHYRDLFIQYEVGAFSEGSFMYRLQKGVSHKITEREILDAWNSILDDLPKERLDYVLSLRKDYKVYLLSNTNHSHIQWARADLRRRLEITDFETRYFDHAYYSHDVKMRKPNLDIYHHVLKHAGIDGQESLFIDDTQENVDAAIAAGIHSVRHDPQESIIEKLPLYLSDLN